jgi:hypothetical protein
VSEAKPIAHLVWQRADLGDDVEAYYEVARPGDKSVDGSDPFPVYELASLTEERDRLREELASTIEELINLNGDDMIDSRSTRVAELRGKP